LSQGRLILYNTCVENIVFSAEVSMRIDGVTDLVNRESDAPMTYDQMEALLFALATDTIVRESFLELLRLTRLQVGSEK
jgi:hypothetical protein